MHNLKVKEGLPHKTRFQLLKDKYIELARFHTDRDEIDWDDSEIYLHDISITLAKIYDLMRGEK